MLNSCMRLSVQPKPVCALNSKTLRSPITKSKWRNTTMSWIVGRRRASNEIVKLKITSMTGTIAIQQTMSMNCQCHTGMIIHQIVYSTLQSDWFTKRAINEIIEEDILSTVWVRTREIEKFKLDPSYDGNSLKSYYFPILYTLLVGE